MKTDRFLGRIVADQNGNQWVVTEHSEPGFYHLVSIRKSSSFRLKVSLEELRGFRVILDSTEF